MNFSNFKIKLMIFKNKIYNKIPQQIFNNNNNNNSYLKVLLVLINYKILNILLNNMSSQMRNLLI